MRFRAYLEKLKETGEIIDTQEKVSWNLQAAAVLAKSIELDGPGYWFKNIEDYPGFSLAGGLYAGPCLFYLKRRKPWTRLAMGLGRDPYISYEELIKLFLDGFGHRGIPPTIVDKGPCKEIVRQGDQVDITEFPIPIIHERDGGRYGSSHLVVTIDPETGNQLYAYNRWMIASQDTLVGHFPVDGPLYRIYSQYERRGQSMPFAILIGVEPALVIASYLLAEKISTFWVSPKCGPVELAGYLAGEPIHLVQAETNDLMIPADAEIVLEGEVPPFERGREGPYPNFVRYEPPSEQPLYKVKAITHRSNPILSFDAEGIKGNDSLVLISLAHSTALTHMINSWFGFKICRWVHVPTATRLGLCIASVQENYMGCEFLISRQLFLNSPWFDKLLIVDDGCGGEEISRCLTDMIIKANPRHSWIQLDNDARPTKTAKYPMPEGTTARLYVNGVLDPTWERELLPTRVSFETTWPKELQEKIIAGWRDLGFVNEPQRRDIKA